MYACLYCCFCSISFNVAYLRVIFYCCAKNYFFSGWIHRRSVGDFYQGAFFRFSGVLFSGVIFTGVILTGWFFPFLLGDFFPGDFYRGDFYRGDFYHGSFYRTPEIGICYLCNQRGLTKVKPAPYHVPADFLGRTLWLTLLQSTAWGIRAAVCFSGLEHTVPRTDIDINSNTITFQDYSSCLLVFDENRDSSNSTITVCAVAQHCYSGDVSFLWEKWPPCKIETREQIETHFVELITSTRGTLVPNLVKIRSRGLLGKRVKYNFLCDFLFISLFFLRPT